MRYVVILTLAISLAAGAVITDLAVEAEGVNTKLIIRADAPFVATSYTLKNPPRIVVDCSGVTSELVGKRYMVHKGGLQQVSVTSFTEQADLIRIVGTLDSDYSYLTLTEGNDYAITLLTGLTSPFAGWKTGWCQIF